MPGALGADYGQLYNQIMPYAEWANTGGQQGVGVDPNYTAAAMALGYIPNPFAPTGSEGQAQMRFLATLKNIMDQQMGGPTGRAAAISPGNPIAGAPGAMSQYLSAAGALMQSPQGRMLLPGNQAAMFQNGYNWNPIDMANATPSGLQQLLIAARSNPAGPNAVGTGGTTVTETSGGNAENGGTSQVAAGNTPALPAPFAQSNIPEGSNRNGQPTATNGGAPNPQLSNQSNLANALQANDQINAGGGVGSTTYGPASPPAPLVQAWNAYINNRTAANQEAKSKELDFWTNPLFQQFAQWVQGALNQPGYSVR